MKYERLHGLVFCCRNCKTLGRWRWWWNRRNGKYCILCRMCPKCGRKRRYKMLKNLFKKGFKI